MSQVDLATGACICEGITCAVKGCTIVEVAHRAGAVRDVDQIIVMGAGRIVEIGTYAELHARGGALVILEARETTDQPSA